MALPHDPLFVGFKGFVAVLLGTVIGLTHYRLSSEESTITEKLEEHNTATDTLGGCTIASISVDTTTTISSEPSHEYIAGNAPQII